MSLNRLANIPFEAEVRIYNKENIKKGFYDSDVAKLKDHFKKVYPEEDTIELFINKDGSALSIKYKYYEMIEEHVDNIAIKRFLKNPVACIAEEVVDLYRSVREKIESIHHS